MKKSLLLSLPLLLLPLTVAGQGVPTDESAPVSVLSFKWSKDRRAMELVDTSTTSPAPAMIAANKNFERQRRINDPAGVRDPNGDTLDGRSAELDRITAQARAAKPQTDGFTYQLRIQNNSEKSATIVFWEYQFRETGKAEMLSRRQFVCLAKTKPHKTKDLEIFTLTAPTAVVTIEALKKSKPSFDESVIINRVEFDDGSKWQRDNWNYDEVKLTANPASDSKRVLQTCRGL